MSCFELSTMDVRKRRHTQHDLSKPKLVLEDFDAFKLNSTVRNTLLWSHGTQVYLNLYCMAETRQAS